MPFYQKLDCKRSCVCCMHLPVLHTDTDVACISAGPDEYRPRLERLRHRAAATGGYCMDQIIIIIITVVLTGSTKVIIPLPMVCHLVTKSVIRFQNVVFVIFVTDKRTDRLRRLCLLRSVWSGAGIKTENMEEVSLCRVGCCGTHHH